MTVVIDPAFDPVPSLSQRTEVVVLDRAERAQAVARFVRQDDGLPEGVALSLDELAAAGFTGAVGETAVIPGTPLTVVVGVGQGITSPAQMRDAVAAFTRAARESAVLALDLTALPDAPRLAAQAATEGAILARYRYDALKSEPKTVRLERLELLVGAGESGTALGAQVAGDTGSVVAAPRDDADGPLADDAVHPDPARDLRDPGDAERPHVEERLGAAVQPDPARELRAPQEAGDGPAVEDAPSPDPARELRTPEGPAHPEAGEDAPAPDPARDLHRAEDAEPALDPSERGQRVARQVTEAEAEHRGGAPRDTVDEARAGVRRGQVLARTASLARDLANTPPRHLSAVRFAELTELLGPEFGLEVEVFDRAQLIELGCGGLLGVNAGSTEEPRMIRLRYTPPSPDSPPVGSESAPHLALVGKGIMYDSGGISLKPSNAMHAAMKLDMMGAAAVFSAMCALRELGARAAVSGWLMCTDNMPSGSATKLGDVLTIRGGTTVEVKNTDAEGRLVLADGLVLATEEARRPDAIVDIATLTGAALAALGPRTAAVFANTDAVAEQLLAAAELSDETSWRLPLDHRYRDQLKSEVADLSNMGGQHGGAILAALFLNEFVDGLPWGHLDIAGTMQSERDDLWRTAGSTGFGARLLAEFAAAFERPVLSGAPDRLTP